MKTRVLFLCDSLCLGGAERVLVDTLATLDYTRFSVHVWMLKDENAFADRTILTDAEIHTVALKQSTPRSLQDMRALLEIWKDIRDFCPNAIHTQGQDADLIGQIMGFAAGIRTIVSTLHLPDMFRVSSRSKRFRYRLKMLIENMTVRCCTEVVAISEKMRSYIVDQRGVPPRCVLLLPNAVTSQQDVVRSALPHPPTFGFIGRLSLQKNLHTSIAAFALVRAEFPTARLLIVGDGVLRGVLEGEVVKQNVSGAVVFFGPRNDVFSMLQEMDALILPSFSEGLPLVILEAMSAGVPVIASDVGGISEVIKQGVTGILIAPPDQSIYLQCAANPEILPVADVAQAILLANAMILLMRDSSLRTRLADNARSFVERTRSLEENVRILERTYESRINHGSHRQ